MVNTHAETFAASTKARPGLTTTIVTFTTIMRLVKPGHESRNLNQSRACSLAAAAYHLIVLSSQVSRPGSPIRTGPERLDGTTTSIPYPFRV